MAGRCTPCHSSDGKAQTPMLREAGDEFCLACHSTRSVDPQRQRSLGMSISARPADIESESRKQYPHRWAMCGDCHSVHGVQSVRKGLVRACHHGTGQGFDEARRSPRPIFVCRATAPGVLAGEIPTTSEFSSIRGTLPIIRYSRQVPPGMYPVSGLLCPSIHESTVPTATPMMTPLDRADRMAAVSTAASVRR